MMAELERKEKDNFIIIALLVLRKSTHAFNLLIELNLSKKNLTFEDFLNQYQHEIYHLFNNTKTCCQCSSEYKLPVHKILTKHHCDILFNPKKRLPCHGKGIHETSAPDCCRPVRKSVTTTVLDLTLSKVILQHFCKDVFWHSCLTKEVKTLGTFLDQHKHLIYHLWKPDTICCQCSNDPTNNFQRSSQFSIEEDQWETLFEDEQPGCLQHKDHTKLASMICAVKAKQDIRISDINDELQEIILKKCCNLRKSVDILERNINNAYSHATSGSISDDSFKRYRSEIEECIKDIDEVCGTDDKEYLSMLLDDILDDESKQIALQLEMLEMFKKEKLFKTMNFVFNKRSIMGSSSHEDKLLPAEDIPRQEIQVNDELKKGHQCDICVEEKKTAPAGGWCSICEQFLCQECILVHARIKVSRGHTVIKIQEFERIPTISLCCERHNKKFEMFCLTHESPFCDTCDHKTCSVRTLDSYVIGIKETDRFQKVESSNEALKTSLENCCTEVQSAIDSIPYKKEVFLSEIQKSREKMSELINDIEKQCLDDISKHEIKMEVSYKQLALCMDKIQENEADISALKSYTSDLHTFIGLIDVEKTYKRCNNSFREFFTENNATTIDPKWTFTTETLKNAVFDMGIKTIIHPDIQDEVSKVDILNVELRKRVDIEIQIPKGRKDTVIRGCALLHNGRMCFTDQDNNRIVFHNTKGGFLFERKLDSSPIDVLSISKSKIAISISEQRSIVLMDVEGKILKVHKFKSNHGHFGGMAFYNEEIIVRVEGFGYYIINTNGEIQSKIEKSHSYVPYIARSNDRIYFPKWDVDKVFCCSSTGEEIWTIAVERLLKPPNGIAADEGGNIFVTGSYSNNVVFITSDGKTLKEVIGGSDLQNPTAISYDIKTKRLLVSCSSGKAFVYSVKM
ncbi:uncharacterized protein [Mytilus edulis]|uniref:uncharacterized protein n=1 Tax=Mytilus edulis TaxID=6550 RepID=UPI0039F13A0B